MTVTDITLSGATISVDGWVPAPVVTVASTGFAQPEVLLAPASAPPVVAAVTIAVPTQIVSSGTTTVSAPTITSYIVTGTGTLDLASGGAVSGATAAGTGSTIFIEAGATATNSSIAGGVQFDYGSATGTVVSNGGTQHVGPGGTATNTTVATGGYQDVWNATVTNTTLSGYQQVLAGGTAIGTLIANGGNDFVGSGGTTKGTIITANGLDYIDAGGTANGTEIDNAGFEYVLGTATASTINSGGIQDVAGTSSGATVSSGGAQHVLSGGTVTATTVLAGGYQDVTGATATGTALYGGMDVRAGGNAVDTAIYDGGHQTIFAGGSASGTVIRDAGVQYVDAGATATDTTVFGGIANMARATTSFSPSFQYVAGTAINDTIDGGAMVGIGPGGVAVGTKLINGTVHGFGGTLQGVDFAGPSGRVDIAFSDLTGTISNFAVGDMITLLGSSPTSHVTSSGFDGSTLSLATTDGNYTYQFAGTQAGTTLNVVNAPNGQTAVFLSLLAQASASLVPGAAGGPIIPHDSTPPAPTLIHAAT